MLLFNIWMIQYKIFMCRCLWHGAFCVGGGRFPVSFTSSRARIVAICTLCGHSNRKESFLTIYWLPQCRWKVDLSKGMSFPPQKCCKFPGTWMELNKNGAFRNSERWVLEADYLVPRCALVGTAAYNTLWVKRIFWAWLSLLRAPQCFLCWGLEISKDWGVGGGEDYGHAMWRGQEDGSNRFVMYHLCPWVTPGQWPVWAENLI